MERDQQQDLLIESYLAGDAEDRDALYQRCKRDPQALNELTRQLAMHRALCGLHRKRGDELWLRLRGRLATSPQRSIRPRLHLMIALAAAALVVAVLVPWTPSHSGAPAGGTAGLAQVSAVSGTATLERAGTIGELRLGHDLVAGDRIVLHGDARLALRHADRSVSELSGAARFRFVSGDDSAVELLHGQLSADVMPREERDRMRILTPHATVTVLGTRLLIEVDAAATRVQVSRGRVQVAERSAAGDPGRIVTAGEELVVAAHRPPTQPAAFPGALGFGQATTHGRGGQVIAVTTLADAGPGSLREAVERQGRRIIVFRVAGQIRLRSQLTIREPFCLIAGQTAPAPGICLSGATLRVATHDVAIRHLRSRPGDDPEGQEPDQRNGFSIGSPDREVFNVVLDHCSVSWSIGEGISVWYGSRDVSVQWCLIGEALRDGIHPRGRHGFGLVVGGGARRISIHRNIFAFNDAQNPMLHGGSEVEVVNNLIAAWGYQGIGIETASGRPVTADLLGNLLVPFPFSTHVAAITTVGPVDPGSSIHVAGNRILRHGSWGEIGLRSLHAPAAERTLRDGLASDPEGLFERLLDGAGAVRPRRDAVDQRLLEQLQTQRGRLIDAVSETPGYDATAQDGPPPADHDGDGMSDPWEIGQGLDPRDPGDANTLRSTGYSNLETYLSELADTP